MSKYVVAIMSFLFVTQASANEVQKNYQFIDVTRGLEWLANNATRIGSVVTEVQYQDQETNETISVQSEIIAPHTPEACQNYDIDDKFTNFFHFATTEELEAKRPGYSRWFEGKKLNGPIIKKTITYCFAS